MARSSAATACVALVALVLSGAGGIAAEAGRAPETPDIDWTAPVNLSNTPQSSGRAAVVADAYGFVHVIWSEEEGGEPLGPDDLIHTGNTLHYTRWDGTSWLEPRGVLYVQGDPLATWVSLHVDADQRLHALWKGSNSYFHSSVPAALAHDPSAWKAPLRLAEHGYSRTQWSADLTSGPDGVLHVVYGTREPERSVFHVRREDPDTPFSAPTRIAGPLPTAEGQPGPLRIAMTTDGRLHAVWEANEVGFGEAIYYARSDPEAERWEPELRLARRGDDDYGYTFPTVFAAPDDVLHIVHTHGSIVGRVHRTSRDSGRTWGPPAHVFTGLHGVNGFLVLLADAADNLHLVINMRTAATAVVGIYHSLWADGEWTSPTAVNQEGPGTRWAHYASGTVRLGNEIHVVYTSNRGGEIWHVRGVVQGVSARSPEPVPGAISSAARGAGSHGS